MILLGDFRGAGPVFGPPNFRHFGFGVDYRLSLGVVNFALRPDTQVSAVDGLPGNFHELLGVLRRIKQLAQLPDLTPPP